MEDFMTIVNPTEYGQNMYLDIACFEALDEPGRELLKIMYDVTLTEDYEMLSGAMSDRVTHEYKVLAYNAEAIEHSYYRHYMDNRSNSHVIVTIVRHTDEPKFLASSLHKTLTCNQGTNYRDFRIAEDFPYTSIYDPKTYDVERLNAYKDPIVREQYEEDCKHYRKDLEIIEYAGFEPEYSAEDLPF